MRPLALLLLLSLAACSGNKPPVPATAHADATASTTVGGVTLQTSTVALADLNDAVAARYGIERSSEGVMLLVTVRDAVGNGLSPYSPPVRGTTINGNAVLEFTDGAQAYIDYFAGLSSTPPVPA